MTFSDDLKRESGRRLVEIMVGVVVGVITIGLVPKATWWWSAPVLVVVAVLAIGLVKGLPRPTMPRLLMMIAAVIASGFIMHWLA
jgi:hypothetical protein